MNISQVKLLFFRLFGQRKKAKIKYLTPDEIVAELENLSEQLESERCEAAEDPKKSG